jgi:hypothetical protein
MLINEKYLKHWIDNFYGYGSWNARFWLIANEESGGELPEEVAERIDYFYRIHPSGTRASLCDIRDLYRHIAIRWSGPKAASFNNFCEYRFDSNAVQNTVWKNLIAFIHGFSNEELPDPLEYQKHTFASPSVQKEALIKLYPLPGTHNHAWYYSWLDVPELGFLKSRMLYQEHLYEQRISRILSNISVYKPEAVLMYGMENINTLKRSVQAYFNDVKFSMIKATRLQIPQHHRAQFNGTTMLITTQIPALRHNRIETGFDWEEFGKVASAGL